jgi:nicotinamidase-related amidase
MPSPVDNPDLHGNVPDKCGAVLLLVDVLNPLDFEGAEAFVPRALQTGERIAGLARRARQSHVPVVYINDNVAGRWRSDLSGLLAAGSQGNAPGRPLLKMHTPEPTDYVVLKPKHSAFFATPLETLLIYLGARHVVLAGFTTDQCVLFTASDAFLRDYRLHVPSDCTDTVEAADKAPALHLMEKRLYVDTQSSEAIDWAELARG